MGIEKTVRFYLQQNKFLVLVYDNMRETGLHWAVKRGLLDIAKYLLKKGAYINARDSLGRTPLYVAAHRGNLEMVRFLLTEKAMLGIKSNAGKRPMDVTQRPDLRKALERAFLLQCLVKFAPSHKRGDLW
jgi:ankyrin repeat protein